MTRRLATWLQTATAALLLTVFPVAIEAQAAGAAEGTPQSENSRPTASGPAQGGAAKPDSTGRKETEKKETLPAASARRRAARLYMSASKLYLDRHFEEALAEYEKAAELDPTNADYGLAAEVARSHAVTALIQAAAKDRFAGNSAGAQASIERAAQLDPKNPEVAQHLDELADIAARGQTTPIYQQAAGDLAGVEPLISASGTRSFHLNMGEHELIEKVFSSFGVTAMVHDSVKNERVRLDLDDVDFANATHALDLVTDTFHVPLDGHRVLVARDTRENRQEFMREALETVYLPELTSEELTQAGNLARNVFGIEQVSADANSGTLTLRAAPGSLDAFNANIHGLMAGESQIVVDVRVIQVAHTSDRNTGVQPPQSISAFNVYSQEQSILNANESLVQEIISSGLASPDDPLAILGILLASGEVSSSLFSGGLALFGGGLTQSAVSPNGPATLTFSLNSSDSRVLDNIQLRLGDGEAGTLKEGTKYPIQTSIYTSASSGASIPGLTGAGASGALGSLLSSLNTAAPTVPMIQYQDLGLTLKITPKVLRNENVALSVDLTLDALSGTSLNGDPILNNQAYSGVVTLKKGESAELASQLSRSQSRAVSGSPGINQIPGLNNVQENDLQKNYATLLIIMTPHVVRATQPAGHTAPIILEKASVSP